MVKCGFHHEAERGAMRIPKRRRHSGVVNPSCMLCDVQTEPTIIYYDDDFLVRGWKCPSCGSTLIHPEDIPKALDLVRETAKV